MQASGCRNFLNVPVVFRPVSREGRDDRPVCPLPVSARGLGTPCGGDGRAVSADDARQAVWVSGFPSPTPEGAMNYTGPDDPMRPIVCGYCGGWMGNKLGEHGTTYTSQHDDKGDCIIELREQMKVLQVGMTRRPGRGK